MKKSKYRELYNKNQKKESTIVVEKKKDNLQKERKGFNVFFDLKDDKKKSSDE